MSVQYVNGNNGLLGTLGTIAQMGGMFIPGAQWLTPLGLGMSTVNGAMNGIAPNIDTIGKIFNGMINAGWINPASGGIGTVSSIPDMTDEQLNKAWNPRYNPYLRGRY